MLSSKTAEAEFVPTNAECWGYKDEDDQMDEGAWDTKML